MAVGNCRSQQQPDVDNCRSAHRMLWITKAPRRKVTQHPSRASSEIPGCEWPLPSSAGLPSGALLDACSELLDLFEGLTALSDLVADLLVGVHHCGVVASTERLTDAGEG